MSASLSLKDNETTNGDTGFDLLDEDGQVIAVLPPDMTIETVSDNPAIADFVPNPGGNGSKGSVKTGLVGGTVIHFIAKQPGQPDIVDDLAVAVVNSAAKSFGINPGTVVPEVPAVEPPPAP